MRDLVDEFMIGPSATQVGVVVYSDSASVVFNLAQFPNKIDLLNEISNLNPTTSGGTNTAQGIQVGAQQFTGPGSRTTARRVMIVVTDGRSNNDAATTAQANAARAANIELFAFGIGNNVNVEELDDIANDPDAEHRFQASDFSMGSLSSFVSQFSTQICPSTGE